VLPIHPSSDPVPRQLLSGYRPQQSSPRLSCGSNFVCFVYWRFLFTNSRLFFKSGNLTKDNNNFWIGRSSIVIEFWLSLFHRLLNVFCASVSSDWRAYTIYSARNLHVWWKENWKRKEKGWRPITSNAALRLANRLRMRNEILLLTRLCLPRCRILEK
jgi:hypothetical protein